MSPVLMSFIKKKMFYQQKRWREGKRLGGDMWYASQDGEVAALLQE
jgi:hypothetical protein